MDLDRLIELSGGAPVIVWLVIIVMLLVMISSATPRVLGPISGAIHDWTERRRAAQAAREDADIADLRRQSEYLARRVSEQAERESRWTREAVVHRQWDRAVQELLIGHEPPVDLAPPFMTPDPPPDTTARERTPVP